MKRHLSGTLVIEIFAILAFAAAAYPQQVAYYVSPPGSDTNSGTENRPFRTIEKARDTVRNINHNMRQDVTVYLRSGTHVLEHSLVFDSNDSGMNGHFVIYRNYPGEGAEISGGRAITRWTRDSGDVWRATTDIADFRQLYINGKRATRAKGGPLTSGELYGGDGYKSSDVNMANWKNPEDIEFVYDKEWDRSICRVAHIAVQEFPVQESSVIITMQQPYFTLLRLKEGINPVMPTFIENARELLDKPGEWYLDKHSHTVYYMPLPGEMIKAKEEREKYHGQSAGNRSRPRKTN